MDFASDSPRSIDPWFFADRVVHMGALDAPERTLTRWLPTADLVVAALDELRARGVLTHPESTHVFRLRDAIEREHESLARLGQALESRPDDEAHHRWLRNVVAHRKHPFAIRGIAALWPEGVAPLTRELATVPDTTSAALLDACTARGLEIYDVAAALRDVLDPAVHHPFVACAVLGQLLRAASPEPERGRALDLLRRFAAVERVSGYTSNPMLDRFAAFFLEHAPREALPIVRRALRGSPSCAASTVALLEAIDEPWCHAEIALAGV